jgi:hypothetical protein
MSLSGAKLISTTKVVSLVLFLHDDKWDYLSERVGLFSGFILSVSWIGHLRHILCYGGLRSLISLLASEFEWEVVPSFRRFRFRGARLARFRGT